MSDCYTKLFSSITDSTIWAAPDTTRLVWITMLAMSDQHGYIGASVPGLATRARVSLEDCVAALETLLAPDKWSRTPDNEGRRIKATDGGWILLNHAKYRAIQNKESRREQARIAMQKLRASKQKTTVNDVGVGEPPFTHTDTDTDTELNTLSGENPTPTPETQKFTTEAEEALEYLNEKSGRDFKPVDSNVKLITARMRDGATLIEIKLVIDAKVAEWLSDEKMHQYLRPSTLFNATKYAQYSGQLEQVDSGKGEWFEFLGKFECDLTPQEKAQLFVARSATR